MKKRGIGWIWRKDADVGRGAPRWAVGEGVGGR